MCLRVPHFAPHSVPHSVPHTAAKAAGAQSSGVSGNSRSRPFPRMKASDSLSRIMGMDFFIPFPFPNFGNAFFSFPSRSRIMGMVFFHSLPVPELWEWIFFIPFPFPNCGNGFFKSLPIPEFAISQKGIKTGIGLL